MTIIEQIRSLSAWNITAIISTILATIAPGFLIVYLYKPIQFEQLDSLKLFVLSISFTLPIISSNAFIMILLGPFVGSIGVKCNNTYKHLVFWLNTWTSVTLYLSIVLAYLLDSSFQCFMLTTVIADLIIGAITLTIMCLIVKP